MVFAAIFGPLLPLPAWDESFYDYLGARPGTSGHFLGTTQDGYDMLAGLVNGAKISASVSFVAVLLGEESVPSSASRPHTSAASST